MSGRARDWLSQALRDLEHSRKSVEMGDYEWACFSAHQAAWKALKALLLSRGVEAWGHDLVRLARKAGEVAGVSVPVEVFEAAAELDKHYVISRYPNGFAEGAPWEHYTARDALGCVRAGEAVVGWVKGVLEGSEGGGH